MSSPETDCGRGQVCRLPARKKSTVLGAMLNATLDFCDLRADAENSPETESLILPKGQKACVVRQAAPLGDSSLSRCSKLAAAIRYVDVRRGPSFLDKCVPFAAR